MLLVRNQAKTTAQQRIVSIYEQVRYRICTNRYPPETVLHEEVLAQEYSVSRSPIRRVFSMLEHEGLVEIKHGIGTIVTSIEPDQLAEVYAVRLILAESMGPSIKIPFDPQKREIFVQCANDFRALSPGDTIGFAEVNIRYMTATLDLSSNATLSEIQQNLFFQTSRMWLMLLPEMPWDETIAAVSDEPLEVVRRMDIEDPVGLAYAIRNHIFKGQQLLLKALHRRSS